LRFGFVAVLEGHIVCQHSQTRSEPWIKNPSPRPLIIANGLL
jgi:hypothetical protein